MTATIPTANLLEALDFLYTNPWTDEGPLRKDMIAPYVNTKITNPTPYPFGTPEEYAWTFSDHMQRVAHLVLHAHDRVTPVVVEIDHLGMAGLLDGNHRLAAHWYLNEPTIQVNFSGYLDYLPTTILHTAL